MATNLGSGDNTYTVTDDDGEHVNGQGGDDIITGDVGDDTLNGGTDDDTLTGMGGDDELIGAAGDDTFAYSFTMTESSGGSGPQSYAAYLEELGLTASTLTQNEFSTSYTAWLNYLVFGDGDDWQGLAELNGWEGEITIGLNQNDYSGSQPNISMDGEPLDLSDIFGDAQHFQWSKGKATQERTYWDIDPTYFGGETTVSSADGNDTITDFKVSDGDMLFFTIDAAGDGTGLSDDEKDDLITEFKTKFAITTGDFDGVEDEFTNPDTKMVLDDGDLVASNDMSITLLGYAGDDAIWNYVEFSFV